MTGKPIKVLVVDDSALMRKILVKMLDPIEDIDVVATAMDGVFALDKLEKLHPDVITLDLEMPRMDGLTTLRRIVDLYALPVVLVSAHTSEGATATFEALAAGGVDFVTKPEKIFQTPLDALSSDLVAKIRVAARVGKARPLEFRNRSKKTLVSALTPKRPGTPASYAKPARDVVAIAVSTGGPNALSYLMAQIRDDFAPGILIVQHMPEGFTGQFAERLSRLAMIEVREAEDGDPLCAGQALLAPGGRHMEVQSDRGQWVVRLSRSEPVRGHRPSADVLFRSVAEVARTRAVGLILTGMGEDGAVGMEALHDAGAHTLAQDEASSVVFGMPRAAIERGAIDKVLPLTEMAEYLNSLQDTRQEQVKDQSQGGRSWTA